MGRGAGIRACGGSGGFVDLSGFQIDAKRRFHAAIDAAGPGLADIAVAGGLFRRGHARGGGALGWPARAGLVLTLALDRVADYYRVG